MSLTNSWDALKWVKDDPIEFAFLFAHRVPLTLGYDICREILKEDLRSKVTITGIGGTFSCWKDAGADYSISYSDFYGNCSIATRNYFRSRNLDAFMKDSLGIKPMRKVKFS